MAKRNYYEVLGVSERAEPAEIRSRLVEHVRAAIENKSAPRDMPVKFVSVDGRGGSGKSSLADLLAREIGAETIRLDDFASWENPLDWWPLVIERVFKPIQGGAKTLGYPRTKWWPNHNPKPAVDQLITPVMILDGVSSSRSEFSPYLTYKIWVDTPAEICLARGVERDKSQGTDQEVKAMWRDWSKKENQYIERDNPVANADLIVDGTVDIYG